MKALSYKEEAICEHRSETILSGPKVLSNVMRQAEKLFCGQKSNFGLFIYGKLQTPHPLYEGEGPPRDSSTEFNSLLLC